MCVCVCVWVCVCFCMCVCALNTKWVKNKKQRNLECRRMFPLFASAIPKIARQIGLSSIGGVHPALKKNSKLKRRQWEITHPTVMVICSWRINEAVERHDCRRLCTFLSIALEFLQTLYIRQKFFSDDCFVVTL